jgi:hypothetical protein
MQVTVLVEFLVTGLAMVIALLSCYFPNWQKFLLANESGNVRLFVLLGLSYCVGIISNFAIYYPIQKLFLRPLVRKYIVRRFKKLGHDLVEETEKAAGLNKENSSAGHTRICFDFMRDMALRHDRTSIDNSSGFQRGLQRLTRGLIVPAVLLTAVYWSRLPQGLRGLLIAGIIVDLCMLIHSVYSEDEDVARAFVLSRRPSPTTTVKLSVVAD